MPLAPATARIIPGPRPAPLFGPAVALLRFLRNPASELLRLHRTYGDVVTLARGSTRYVFAFGPDNNRRVLGDTALFHALDKKTLPLRIPEGGKEDPIVHTEIVFRFDLEVDPFVKETTTKPPQFHRDAGGRVGRQAVDLFFDLALLVIQTVDLGAVQIPVAPPAWRRIIRRRAIAI